MRPDGLSRIGLWAGVLFWAALCLAPLPAAGEGPEVPALESAPRASSPESAAEPAAVPLVVGLAAGDAQRGPVEFFRTGGLFMWPLLVCAIVTLIVIVERLFTYQRQTTDTRRLMAAIVGHLKTGGIERAKHTCIHTRGPVAAILHAGLSKIHLGPSAVEKAIESAGAIEAAFLERGLIVLSSVAQVAPLLGFLGTVSGMIHAFDAIAATDRITPRIVADGVSEALITSLVGLVVAIPGQIAFSYFASRVDRFVIEMEESAVELVDFLTEASRAT
jgi:biopolymer transport protein ExbB